MLQTFRLGWRNLWRNGHRTLITLAAVAFATSVLVMTDALLRGMADKMVRNATDLVVGEAQAHAPDYLAKRSFYDSLEDVSGVLARADAAGIEATPRSHGYGLVAQGTKSAGVLLWGIDPEREARTTDLAEHLRAGRFLDPSPHREMILGHKLARTLGVEIGAEVVVVVQAADGSLGNELFHVSGILSGVGEALDRGGALVHAADFEELFVAGGRVHEIAFNTRGELELVELRARLEAIAPRASIRTWRELRPMLSDMMGMMDGVIWMLSSIFFLAAGLGVLNTLLMATFERIPEFGVLKAIGASPLRIVGDLAAEASLLGALGASIGAVLGGLGAFLLERHGIDTSSFGTDLSFAGVVWDPVWYAALAPSSIIVPALAMWTVCVVAALYPALIAARLDPVEAMRHT